jgi:N-acetylglucosaminyldiphosphoundecaprenol N-acetyl-beta-D-mannosaminyltransferase
MKRTELLGCPLDVVDMDQALDRCERAIADRDYLQHMSINAAKVVAVQDDPELRRMISSCDLVTADGQSVVWAARLLGTELPERVAGIDLMQGLMARGAKRGYRIFILGARRDVLDRALERIRADYPGLAIAGARDGYYDDSEAEAVCQEIRDAKADILFVAMSSPRKEYFLGHRGATLGVPFAMGVGGSVDVIAGITRRAPVPLQRMGLEWAYRLVQEPRRLAGRYLRTNGRFALLVLNARLSRRASAARAGVAPAGPDAEAREAPGDRPGSA